MAESMGAEQARADVAALFAAIERAQAAAQRVEAVFLATSGSLKGEAAQRGMQSATAIANDISRAARVAGSAGVNLRGVANTLSETKAKAPVLRAAAAELAKSDLTADETAQVRAAVAAAMNTVYSDPMLDTAIPLGIEPTVSAGHDNAAVSPVNPGAGQRDNGSTSFNGLGSGLVPGSAGSPGSPTGTTTKTPSTGNPAPSAAGGTESAGPSESAKNPGGASPSGPASTNNPKDKLTGDRPGPSTVGRGDPGVVGGPRLGQPGLGQPRPGPGSGLSGRTPGTIAGAGTPKPPLTTPRLGMTTTGGPPATTAPLRSTGSGMRGGMPFAPRATRSEEADDRRAADYLHVRENADEIVGELPLVGPPVLGEPDPPSDPDVPANRGIQ